MPEISRFLGIVIYMYYREHAPPHFHARYGEYRISVEIGSGIVDGRFPPRALRHVQEWLASRRGELFADWARARAREPLREIAPLE